MSVTVAKGDGVTVFTLTSDPQSNWPPLCQILKNLCYSPVCCSVSQHLRRIQRTSQSVLGALHIMVGLLNIGLGVILTTSYYGSWYQMMTTGFPFWLGGIFIFFGAVNILSEKCPSPCLVIINVILNVAGVGFAIAAIVLYSINIANMRMWGICDYNYYGSRYNTVSPFHAQIMEKECEEGKELVKMLLKSINAVLIVLSVLELCVTASSAILGIKALWISTRRQNKSIDHPEHNEPLLEQVTGYPIA